MNDRDGDIDIQKDKQGKVENMNNANNVKKEFVPQYQFLRYL